MSFTQHLCLLVSVLLLHLAAVNAPSKRASSITLELEIGGMKKSTGNFFIAIYNNPKGFRLEEYAFLKKVEPISQIMQRIVFKDLPKGTYAVAIFQDWNGNQKLDLNWIGIPTEPYGFSNNPKLLFGPPNFEQCAFEATTEMVRVPIDLK
jgi:uncharacterized protein (DUF2141 family)